MKHTPWFIDPKAETHVVSKDRAICSISFFDGNPKTREENKSIAYLIAAAPDLLEALEYLVGECDSEMDDDYNPHAAPLSKAHIAIKKARGET